MNSGSICGAGVVKLDDHAWPELKVSSLCGSKGHWLAKMCLQSRPIMVNIHSQIHEQVIFTLIAFFLHGFT